MHIETPPLAEAATVRPQVPQFLPHQPARLCTMKGQITAPPLPLNQLWGWSGLHSDKERNQKASKSARAVAESVFKNDLESNYFSPSLLGQECTCFSLLDAPNGSPCFCWCPRFCSPHSSHSDADKTSPQSKALPSPRALHHLSDSHPVTSPSHSVPPSQSLCALCQKVFPQMPAWLPGADAEAPHTSVPVCLWGPAPYHEWELVDK